MLRRKVLVIITDTICTRLSHPSSTLGVQCRLFSSSLNKMVATHENSKVISRTYKNVQKSENDDRKYKGLILSNGLKILLISDPNTDKAAAALDVNVGYASDPSDLPGLAHFCEHMLFLGTKKYPNEDEYHKYINQHGGSCNAYTSTDHTNYYFDVGHEHLKGALDRFSQFFIDPLFDVCCSDREVNAVHSEHEKNIMSDAWRLQMLDKTTCDQSHVFSKFGTGNKETLDSLPKQKGLNVRDELLKFHEKFYSSNIMGLSMIGRESLDELTEIAMDLFSSVVNKDVKVPVYQESPYRKEDMEKRCNSVPVKDIRNLIVTFPIPDLQEYYDSNPGSYLGHLIGHEGPGSLLSELKNQGWVNSLVAGQKGGSRGFDFFLIQVDLTETGIYHVEDIIQIMFQYIKLLKSVGHQDWIHHEIRDISAISFRFKDKEKPSSYVSKVSQALHYFPLDKVLSAGNILTGSRPDVVQDILERLNADNMKVDVVAKAFDGSADLSEKWYGTKYALVPITNETKEKWNNVELNDKLRLPEPNEFIPSSLSQKLVPESNPELPKLIKMDNFSKVWFKQDSTFNLPKATISVDFYSPYAYVDPHHYNMVHLFVDLFVDALNEYSYAAEIAGLGFKLSNTVYGMCLTIDGYEDKQMVLLEKILTRLTNFTIDPQRFTILKELYQRALQNFHADQPYNHSAYYCQVLRSEVVWTKTKLYEALPELTLESVSEFIPTFLSYLHFESLMHGNLTKKDASNITSFIEKTLKENTLTLPLLPSQLVRYRDIELPPKSAYVYKYHHEVRDNSAIQLYLQVGLQNTRDNCLLDLTSQMISEPFFNILRTKEQLGYVVHCSVTRSNSTQGIRFIVQSEKSPNYLEARIEAFINHVETMFSEMDESEFNRHKAALKARRLEKPKKLKAQTLKYWGEILSQQYMFERDQIEMSYLDNVEKEDVVTFYKDFLHINGGKRAKLSTYIIGKSNVECPVVINVEEHNKAIDDCLLKCPQLPASHIIEDVSRFKQKMSLYPRCEPYIDLAGATL
ncbi:insulin-degrading enzyme-like [Styela clava]